MSGHSKWAQIKRQKGVTDGRRGKLFTKLGREIQLAARQGGADPNGNAALRLAVAKAKQGNMPKETIERAITRGAGQGGADQLEAVRYEAYGPGGAALLIDALTDNRNRTVAEVRSTVTKSGGNMSEAGAVGWLFTQRGVVTIDISDAVDTDAVALAAIDAGAEDVEIQESLIEVLCPPSEVESVRAALEASGAPIASAEVAMRPTTSAPLDERQARSLLRLIETLDDLDDVQRIYTNADIPDSALVEV